MNRRDLIEGIVRVNGMTYIRGEELFDSLIKVIQDGIREDRRVEIRGFGNFQNRLYRPYVGRNPKTGQIVNVRPKKVPFFKPGKDLKLAVNEARETYRLNVE